MGLFRELKMVGSIVKEVTQSVSASMKASDMMDNLIEEARGHVHDTGFLTPNNLKCIREYDAAKDADDNRSTKLSQEECQKLTEAKEKSEVNCMKSFQLNKNFSQEFRDNCKEAVRLYNEANDDDKLYNVIEDSAIKCYKWSSPEEEALVRKLFAQAKQSTEAVEEMEKLIEEAKTHAVSTGFLTAADKAAITTYDNAKAAREKASNKTNKKATAERNALDEALEKATVACMTAFQKNMKFTPKFRTSCKNSAKLYADTENAMVELMKYEK